MTNYCRTQETVVDAVGHEVHLYELTLPHLRRASWQISGYPIEKAQDTPGRRYLLSPERLYPGVPHRRPFSEVS